MKKLSFLFCVTLCVSAAVAQQSITATSTAEECVQFINQKLKTSIGSKATTSSYSEATLTDVQFTGGKYMYQTEFSSSKRYTDSWHGLYQTHVSDINWAAYQSFFTKQNEYYKALYIKVVLQKAHPVAVQSKYYNFLSGAMDGGYPAYKTDTLTLHASLAEQAAVNELDKAFKRLSQLAKENPSLFKTDVFKPKVIEGKASFNETIDYLYNNLPRKLSYYGTSYDQYGNYEGAVDLNYTSMQMVQIHNTDSILIEWAYNYRVPKYLAFEERRITKKVVILFSMKDVERLNPFNYTFLNGFVTLEKAREATFPCGIGLFAKQGKKLFRVFEYNYTDGKVNVQMQSDIGIPISYYSNKDNVETVLSNIQNSQLYKAFNHLRNLCGAPDPLKFD